jgi:hypothetical protein
MRVFEIKANRKYNTVLERGGVERAYVFSLVMLAVVNSTYGTVVGSYRRNSHCTCIIAVRGVLFLCVFVWYVYLYLWVLMAEGMTFFKDELRHNLVSIAL